MKELITRWKAELPLFWKKIRTLAIGLVSASTAVWTINAEMDLGLHDWVITFCKYAIAVGAAIGLSAQMTKK